MIGSLRHRIELLVRSRLADEAGGGAVIFTPVETVWAGLERLPSARDPGGDRDRRLRRLSATIRMRSDVAPGGRIRFEGVPYDIVSVEPAPARAGPERYVALICEEALS